MTLLLACAYMWTWGNEYGAVNRQKYQKKYRKSNQKEKKKKTKTSFLCSPREYFESQISCGRKRKDKEDLGARNETACGSI